TGMPFRCPAGLAWSSRTGGSFGSGRIGGGTTGPTGPTRASGTSPSPSPWSPNMSNLPEINKDAVIRRQAERIAELSTQVATLEVLAEALRDERDAARAEAAS